MTPYAAAIAVLLASPAAAQTDEPVAPKTGTIQLHPVFIDKQQTAFVDVASLVRSGDRVDGWGLNIYLNPTEVAPGKTTTVHWTRFQMSCSAKTATVTWLLGRDLITTTFKTRVGRTFAIQDKTGWDQTYYYICKGVPLFKGKAYTSETIAVVTAKSEMKRKP